MCKLIDYMDEDVKNLFNDQSGSLKLTIDLKNPEINVKELAESLGCTVSYKYLFSETGSYNNETKEIIVNLFDPVYRQRFTLAHELVHHLLGDCGISYREKEVNEFDLDYILHERQVNHLAAKILMPEKIIEKIFDELSEYPNLIKVFAEKFNVSYAAMEYRLQSLRKI